MNRISINTENDEYQIIESLKLNRAKRAKAHEVFIEGIESIKQAIKANREITRIITARNAALSDWAKDVIAAQEKARNIEMPENLYQKLCDRQEASEMLVTAKIKLLKLNELLLPDKPFILLFDRPGDTGNLGSVIRSANAFNVDALFVLGHAADVYDPKTIRASLGSVFHTKIILVESFAELEAFIQNEKIRCGIKIYGTDTKGDMPLTEERLQRPVIVALGNEAKGISVALKNICDGIMGIPITGEVNSLNVASAASIFMWEVYKNS
ncbi:RNA methyltransferase [Leadbettera azotonutricia]|uniref:Putative tRNA/rRNA methyltransferase n=1 Tax=Leadbettera azotonutricia (strain ATCC BAA-888 / DSM 13862 / ZAS-9) TaxID=545695 RepID=F5YBG2_LEAAZ|nr:RNA methyltransferase [Leadbettera azotonutricia]AEF82177.1 putative tRNA/rRNA methyltransferase [Leadbettera azotonutricia ZAS-9]